MKFKIIACFNKNFALGKNGKLLYHIKNDMQNFRRLTSFDGVVIMGRKTFESLPNQQPLPNRINIVITSNKDWTIEGEYDNLYAVDSVDMAIEFCEAYFSDKNCYVIGGASLYNQFIEKDVVDTMYLTVVNDEKDGDVFFPQSVFEGDDWYKFYESYTQRYRPTETTYKFLILQRKKS